VTQQLDWQGIDIAGRQVVLDAGQGFAVISRVLTGAGQESRGWF